MLTNSRPTSLLIHAANFAADRHATQRRRGTDTPYVNHPLAVARRLIDQGGIDDTVTLAAAILHDTVEDTKTSHEELRARFGDEVAAVVAEVTDDRRLPKAERKRAQVRKAGTLSASARAVKLADKLDNLSDLLQLAPPTWSPARVRGYFAWAATVVDRMRGTNHGLEAALDAVFASDLTTADGRCSRAVPTGAAEREHVLQAYLAAIEAERE
ncbi:MAG: HD domain-containing protein [Planctomycetota bacterium]